MGMTSEDYIKSAGEYHRNRLNVAGMTVAERDAMQTQAAAADDPREAKTVPMGVAYRDEGKRAGFFEFVFFSAIALLLGALGAAMIAAVLAVFL